jgi:predicted PurR-regulated permease PerM
MGVLDRRTISILLTIAFVVGFVALIWAARRPVIVFILAIFFAYLLDPLVVQFEGWMRLSRGQAVGAAYLVILLALFIFGLTIGPRILQQVQHLGQRLPDFLEQVKTGKIALQLGGLQGWSNATQERIQSWLISHQDEIARSARDVARYAEQLAANLAWILLVPILAIFFLKDRSKLRASFVEWIGTSNYRNSLDSILNDLDTMLAQYIRAQLMLMFLAFIAYGAFLLIARLPYALAAAAIAGMLEFVPIAGPLLALLIILGIAFLTGYPHWPALILFWLAWRGIEDYVVAPRVMGTGLDLHPLLAIFAVLVGGELGGVLGVFLSIPAVAALRILWLNAARRGSVRKAA